MTPKKSKKTKSAKKIKDDDESGLETGSGVEKKEVKRTGGFHVCTPQGSTLVGRLGQLYHIYMLTYHPQKPMNLSPALSILLEEEFVS